MFELSAHTLLQVRDYPVSEHDPSVHGLVHYFHGMRGKPFDNWEKGSPSPSKSASFYVKHQPSVVYLTPMPRFRDSSDEDTILGNNVAIVTPSPSPSPPPSLSLTIETSVPGRQVVRFKDCGPGSPDPLFPVCSEATTTKSTERENGSEELKEERLDDCGGARTAADTFNLTGLNTEVQYYQYALELVTDVFDMDCEDEMREQIEKSARHLYGLVHARYIVTTRGLSKMLEKFKKSEFGKCPRVMCGQQPLLPMGQNDTPNNSAVKLYCVKCEDLYNPKSTRHSQIDGAYFGTSFHNILFQVYPAMLPAKSTKRYEPKVFGFKVHAAAALQRWQEERREEMVKGLKREKIEFGFVEDIFSDESSGEEEEEDGIPAVPAIAAGAGQGNMQL
ncbi:tRNA (guanine-N(7)-)-methyltransferase [Venturia inaequalis]|nr:tRNA (guanine-N(7)-)-methyltransferase [Venturia inaequalis]